MAHKSARLALSPTRAITVTVPRDVGFNLKKIQKIQEELVGRLGHAGCYSGFDILFRLESDFVVDPESLDLEALGGAGH